MRIAYCFVRIAVRIVSGFLRIDPALDITYIYNHFLWAFTYKRKPLDRLY